MRAPSVRLRLHFSLHLRRPLSSSTPSLLQVSGGSLYCFEAAFCVRSEAGIEFRYCCQWWEFSRKTYSSNCRSDHPFEIKPQRLESRYGMEGEKSLLNTGHISSLQLRSQSTDGSVLRSRFRAERLPHVEGGNHTFWDTGYMCHHAWCVCWHV